VGLSDELRADAGATLAAFGAAGVALKIISGDHPETVAALALQAGLGPEITRVSGPALEAMSPAEFDQAAEETTVFGRITPRQKERLIAVLRARGHYVAMIGDGVNDVLALKKANLASLRGAGARRPGRWPISCWCRTPSRRWPPPSWRGSASTTACSTS